MLCNIANNAINMDLVDVSLEGKIAIMYLKK